MSQGLRVQQLPDGALRFLDEGREFTVPAPGPVDASYLVLGAHSRLSTERVLTPRDFLRATDAGAGGAYSVDWDPNDPTVVVFWDDFLGGGTTTPNLGLAWQRNQIAAAPSHAFVTGALPNLGVIRMTTTTTAAQGGVISLQDDCLGNLAAVAGWELHWIFALSSVADVRFRIGLGPSAKTSIEPVTGIWLRLDTNVAYGDTAFQYVCRSASTNTVVSSGVTAATGFHKLRIRSTVAGTILFKLNATTEQSIATNVPTAALSPEARLATDAAAAKDLDLDFFAFRMRGVAR
jgi:hypothetical protein